MDKEFILYEEALALKKLGFDEPCLRYYHFKYLSMSSMEKQGIDWTLAPLYQQAFRWFREEHELHSYVARCMGIRAESYIVDIYTLTEVLGILDKKEDQIIFDLHEEAELACLRKLIEIVKQK